MNKPMMVGPAALKKVKVAHKFLTKWYVGSFKSKCYAKESANYVKFAIYYHDDQNEYYHDLKLNEYGIENFWVLIKKKN